MNEVEAIASDPLCLNLLLLKGIEELKDLKENIKRRVCEGS